MKNILFVKLSSKHHRFFSVFFWSVFAGLAGLVSTLSISAAFLMAPSAHGEKPAAATVVEQQVEKRADQKAAEVVDPSATDFKQSLEMLTPDWAQDILLKNRASFIRPVTGVTTADKKNIALLTDEEKKSILLSLRHNIGGDVKSLETDVTLQSSVDKVKHTIEASVRRAYLNEPIIPEKNAVDDLSQQFREMIRINQPASLHPYTWLTFRFERNPFDRVWVYTPQTKLTRPISPLMRSDSLFYSALSADDVFGSSENLNQLEASFEEVKLNYVLMSLAQLSETTDGGCKTYTELPNAGDPLSIKANLFARPTISVSLLNKDPFANYGKLTVVVDRETGAVVYKKIWNRDGSTKGIVLNGLYESVNPKAALSAWTYRENKDGTNSTLHYHRIKTCSDSIPSHDHAGANHGGDPAEFDPARLSLQK